MNAGSIVFSGILRIEPVLALAQDIAIKSFILSTVSEETEPANWVGGQQKCPACRTVFSAAEDCRPFSGTRRRAGRSLRCLAAIKSAVGSLAGLSGAPGSFSTRARPDRSKWDARPHPRRTWRGGVSSRPSVRRRSTHPVAVPPSSTKRARELPPEECPCQNS